MDPDKLKDVLFRLFESQDAWNIKDLVSRTNQPHVRTCLSVCLSVCRAVWFG